MVYYNPYIIGEYNPLYTLNNQVFFTAQMPIDWNCGEFQLCSLRSSATLHPWTAVNGVFPHRFLGTPFYCKGMIGKTMRNWGNLPDSHEQKTRCVFVPFGSSIFTWPPISVKAVFSISRLRIALRHPQHFPNEKKIGSINKGVPRQWLVRWGKMSLFSWFWWWSRRRPPFGQLKKGGAEAEALVVVLGLFMGWFYYSWVVVSDSFFNFQRENWGRWTHFD